MNCVQCGEPLTGIEAERGDFHRSNAYWHPIPIWDACLTAATGDPARLLRVHRKMAEREPLLARAYAGDA